MITTSFLSFIISSKSFYPSMQNMRKDGLVCIRRLNKKTKSFFCPPLVRSKLRNTLLKKAGFVVDFFLSFHPSLHAFPCGYRPLSFRCRPIFMYPCLPSRFVFALYSSTNFPCDDERESVCEEEEAEMALSQYVDSFEASRRRRPYGWLVAVLSSQSRDGV
jgi:hypothetical protein